MSYLDPSSYAIMLGAQIPSFCRMIGRNKHVWSHIVRMRKRDILQRGSQIKVINMKVYIEDMYREKTDINVLVFCKQRRRNHHNEYASKSTPGLNYIVYYNIRKKS